MARTQAQILTEINTEAHRYGELAPLQQNRSRVSVWGYAKEVIAFAIRTLEEYYDTHKQEVQALISAQQIGSPAWYAEQARRFQHGHRLLLVNHRPGYQKDDPKRRIIKHVAIEEGTGNNKGKVIVKVVKNGTEGARAPLSEQEKQAFQAYLNAITFAGIKAEAQSQEATEITLHATIQVDAQLIVPSRINNRTTTHPGARVGTEKKPVEEAVKAYFRNLPFNGIIRRTALEDAIQAVPGVIDLKTNSNPAKTTPFPSTHQPASGHAQLADASTFSYQTNIIS